MFTISFKPNHNPKFNTCIISNNKGTKAVFYPQLGASLQQLFFDHKTIINNIIQKEGEVALLNSSCSAILFPFANRIKDGKYQYENKVYQLECNETARGHALHGLVYQKAFQFSGSENTENHASISFSYEEDGNNEGFPFPFKITLTYRLSETQLRLDIEVQNTGNNSFPFSAGWHPYFYSNDLAKSVISMQSNTKIKTDARMIPTGTAAIPFPNPLELKDSEFDDGYILTDSNIGFQTLDYKINIRTEQDNTTQYAQLYIPSHRQSIAIEPMTGATDCFNNNMGVKYLAPKEFYHISWLIDDLS